MFQNNDAFILKKINYVDVINHSCVINKDIVVENGIISHIEENISSHDSENVFDCTNLWAIPSFIDTHVHLSFNPFCCDDFSNERAIILNLTDATLAGTCLVRDLGSNGHLSKEIISVQKQNRLCFPEIITAGTPLCINSGHGSEYGVSVAQEGIDEWLFFHKKNGHTWVKIMNDPERHSQDFLNKVVLSAHKIGLKVACHVFTPKGICSAISAGVDSVEHSLPHEKIYLKNAAKMFFVPTAFSAFISIQDDFLNQVTAQESQHLIDWYNFLHESFRKSYINSCNISTGTDGGCAPSRLSDIKNEIKFLANQGIDNMQCLCAASINGALLLGKEEEYGSISIGKYANIIVFKNNPVENINEIDAPLAIWLRGTKIKKEVTFL